MPQYIKIIKIVDNDKGSVNIIIDIDAETLKHFACLGIIQIIKEACNETIKKNSIN